MIIRTRLHNAILNVIKQTEIELRASQNDKITRIAELWVRWNAREITDRDAMGEIEHILREETEFSWRKFIGDRTITIIDGENTD